MLCKCQGVCVEHFTSDFSPGWTCRSQLWARESETEAKAGKGELWRGRCKCLSKRERKQKGQIVATDDLRSEVSEGSNGKCSELWEPGSLWQLLTSAFVQKTGHSTKPSVDFTCLIVMSFSHVLKVSSEFFSNHLNI